MNKTSENDSGDVVAQSSSVNVEIPLALLERLLSEGQICVAQLRSLDRESHQQLKQLCLNCCAKRVRNESGKPEASQTEPVAQYLELVCSA